MRRSRSAAVRAAVSTTGPREMFTRIAVDFILARAAIGRVLADRGQRGGRVPAVHFTHALAPLPSAHRANEQLLTADLVLALGVWVNGSAEKPPKKSRALPLASTSVEQAGNAPTNDLLTEDQAPARGGPMIPFIMSPTAR
jgi:hypothetical protein